MVAQFKKHEVPQTGHKFSNLHRRANAARHQMAKSPVVGMFTAASGRMIKWQLAREIVGFSVTTVRSCLFLMCFLLSICPLAAKTNYSASVAYADVAAAIAASTEGDIVQIPPGNATWTSTLQLSKPVTLRGAGTNSTIVNGTGNTLLSVALSIDRPVRVSGIFFNQPSGTAQPSLIINGRTASGSGTPITSFRIDQCKFRFGKRALNPRGWCYGVVDHCTFINCDIAVGITGDDNNAWARPIQPGSTNAVCIEDNAFVIDNNAPSEPNETIYHQEATRTVIRYNNFDGSTYTAANSIFMDAHGNQNYYNGGGDFRGSILVECYNNTFTAYKTYRLLYYRAGSLLIYSNSFRCISGRTSVFAVTEEESWQSQFFSPLRTSWPAQDQITNTFLWANTLNGTPVTGVTLWNPNDSTFIQQNRDYWMEAPSSVNGRPAGVYANYRPLIYPHPMVTAQDSGSVGNTNETVVSSLANYSFAAGFRVRYCGDDELPPVAA